MTPEEYYDAITRLPTLIKSEIFVFPVITEKKVMEALKELDGGPNGGFDKASEIIKDTLYSHVAGSS